MFYFNKNNTPNVGSLNLVYASNTNKQWHRTINHPLLKEVHLCVRNTEIYPHLMNIPVVVIIESRLHVETFFPHLIIPTNFCYPGNFSA